MHSAGAETDTSSQSPTDRRKMPVLFVGQGSPEFTMGNNPFNHCWKAIGKNIPRPSAILCISAHLIIQEGTAVTAMEKPKTIHDFYGSQNPSPKLSIVRPVPRRSRSVSGTLSGVPGSIWTMNGDLITGAGQCSGTFSRKRISRYFSSA